jgi:hypothetical protein
MCKTGKHLGVIFGQVVTIAEKINLTSRLEKRPSSRAGLFIQTLRSAPIAPRDRLTTN